MEEMRKQPSKLEGPGGAPLSEENGAVITVGVLGFWLAVGAFDMESNLVGSNPLENVVTVDPVIIGLNPNIGFKSFNL